MADANNQNGISIGNFASSFNSGLVPSSAPVQQGSDPNTTIPANQQQLTQAPSLQYPADQAKYYTGFNIYKYQRQDLMQIGSLSGATILNSIALPLPDQMLDVNQVAFDKQAFSATIGNAINSGFAGYNSAPQNLASQITQTGASAVAGGAKGAVVDAAKGIGGADATGLAGALGYSPNYFLTVILNGPQYKQYTMNWTMAPRSPQEAATLTQIIRVFKDAMSPGLSLGGLLFNFPRIFQNYYAPNRGALYQFKPSVLVNFAVNYTPGGAPSMKQADSTYLGGWNAPSALRISATFLELEFWLRGDFGSTSNLLDPNANAIQPVDVRTDST